MEKRQNRTIKKADKNHFTVKKIIVIFTVLIGIAITVLHGTYRNALEMKNQMVQNLSDVAKQNATIAHTKIHKQYALLNALSKELEDVTEDTIEEKLGYFKVFLDEFKLKRFAYCFPDGTTYSTDGGTENLSYREFYQEGMNGHCCITGILNDALIKEKSKNQVNVMTIPVYDNTGTVKGVFGTAYYTDDFNEALQIESFDGEGYTCIFNENGEIIATMEDKGLELSSNIIDDVLKKNNKNEKCIHKLQNMMQNNKPVNGSLYLPEKSYYYCIPLDLMNHSVTWYICTIVPADIVTERVSPLLNNQYVTSAIIMLLVLIGAVLFIMYIQEQHKQMFRFAYEDLTTHGANYAKFCVEMDYRSDNEGYLVLMDITNFDNISLVAGEDSSDFMLQETWKTLDASLNKGEYAGRIRDDVFILFLLENKEEDLINRMEQISQKLRKKASIYQVYGIQARYGVYRMSEAETLKNAYSKVKMAKEYAATKTDLQYAFYDEINQKQMQYEKQLEDSFTDALEGDEFTVWYQPKYSATDCTIVGSEALVRWQKKNGEMISPGEFIPLFEKNGMIVQLDEYMFRTVCQQQKKWLDEGKTVYPVSVNVSRASLYRSDVEQRYKRIMLEYEIDPQYIQLEVTETMMKARADIGDLLNRFRHMGIKILMDDFGTGYSSFSTLSSQCFDTLKLDKTLIDHIGEKDGETMLYHIIHMGQQMGLHITAEGVETKTQVEFLQHMKCDDIQGFYFSRPLPLNEYEKKINSREA